MPHCETFEETGTFNREQERDNSQSQAGHWFDAETISSSNHYPQTHPNMNNHNPNNNMNKNASQAFVERWCDLQGVDFEYTGTKAWQQRGPAFFYLPA
jgi:hypothetical protein